MRDRTEAIVRSADTLKHLEDRCSKMETELDTACEWIVGIGDKSLADDRARKEEADDCVTNALMIGKQISASLGELRIALQREANESKVDDMALDALRHHLQGLGAMIR